LNLGDARALFRLAPDHVHLAACLLATHPRPVREAIERHRDGFDENPALYFETHVATMEERLRMTAAAHLGCGRNDVAFVESTTAGLGMVASGVRLGDGEILTTTHDHYALHESLRLRSSADAGATIRKIALYDDAAAATPDEIVTRVVDAVGPRTRLIALTWVHSVNGIRLPLADIANAVRSHCHDRGWETPLLLVDGVHGYGVEDQTPIALGCDIFVSGCHKWLFGPRGTGIVWASSRGWQSLAPTIASNNDVPRKRAWLRGEPFAGPTTGVGLTPGGMRAFDHLWALPEAFEMQLGIGKTVIADHSRSLATRLANALRELPRVRFRGPRHPELSSAIVCFEVEGLDAFAVVERLLALRIVGGVTPYRAPYVRLTPSIVNTVDEIDGVVDAVASV
jgi:isopenicillin-N epimerase